MIAKDVVTNLARGSSSTHSVAERQAQALVRSA
jgi:hypothetical protein